MMSMCEEKVKFKNNNVKQIVKNKIRKWEKSIAKAVLSADYFGLRKKSKKKIIIGFSVSYNKCFCVTDYETITPS